MIAKIYNFKDMEQFVDVQNKMLFIQSEDPSFHVSKIDEKNMYIFLEHENKDILNKKAVWVIHKLDNEKRLVYDIE